MPVTLNDLITDALMDLGVLGEGGIPDAGQSAQGLRRINRLLNQWRTENLHIPTIVRATATLTASQASFTVGTGGNINIPRPGLGQVERVAYIDTAINPDLELSLGPLLLETEYEAITQKAQTGTRPSRVYYTPTTPTGTLYPFPIPTDANLQWAFYYHAPIAAFAAIMDTVTVPDGYEQLIVKSLAMELAPSFQRQPNPVLIAQAAEAKRMVTRSNGRLVLMRNDAADILNGWGRGYDIKAG